MYATSPVMIEIIFFAFINPDLSVRQRYNIISRQQNKVTKNAPGASAEKSPVSKSPEMFTFCQSTKLMLQPQNGRIANYGFDGLNGSHLHDF